MTFREKTLVLKAGQTANIPANAPHRFVNAADQPARLLCMCAPAGQEEFFLEIGDRVEGRTTPPPKINETEQAERAKKAEVLASQFRTAFVKP